ncbi:MAG: EVE domain-containing protein [Planctomycetes bacterium]|jgi:predicted RNA-binding protein with PUA-like domain|nr:EVE domain-containing protein [Planctomycetota bacterium]
MAKRFWLVKSEPGVYSIDDLERDGVTAWSGVRNYQARNFMRDDMRVGDTVLFYASGDEPGITGLAEVCKTAYPDETAFKKGHESFDAKSNRENPTWFNVDIKFVRQLAARLELSTLKKTPGLERMMVTQKGSRLSVQPVRPEEWEIIAKLAK